MEEVPQPTCWAGLQVIGTLLGTMFGFVSAALLASKDDVEGIAAGPAAPGVVIGSSIGVLAAHSAGDGDQSLHRLAYRFVLSLTAAAVMTTASRWVAGEALHEGGIVGILTMATVASLGSTIMFVAEGHNTLLNAAMAAMDNSGSVQIDSAEEDYSSSNPKQV